jgi:hypothetical protein
MFDETLCDRCGDCLVRCLYVDYDKEQAAFEIDELIAGRSARILSACTSPLGRSEPGLLSKTDPPRQAARG